jgi:DNA-binding NtrC family response regulator
MEGPMRSRASGTSRFGLGSSGEAADALRAPGEDGRPSGKQRIRPSLSSQSAAIASAGRCGVLVVDDDPAVLQSIEAILSFDFNVVCCSTPDEALRRFDPNEFQVVCSDYMMPRMDGRKLLSEILRRSDMVCCLLMTARVDLEPLDRDFPVVFKPFDPERFVHTVGHLVRIAEMKRSTRALNEATGTSSVPPRSRKP